MRPQLRKMQRMAKKKSLAERIKYDIEVTFQKGSKDFRPMLAATAELADIKYPVYASPKLDGIRGVIVDGVLKSRSLKAIPNTFVSNRFSRKEYDGLDGELIFGSATAKDVYRQTNSHCSRIEGTPEVEFWVFDIHNQPNICYVDRLRILRDISKDWYKVKLMLLTSSLIKNEEELLKYETEWLKEGYEGLILRGPNEHYKFGRSTLRSQGMLKLKRFLDSEMEVLGIGEEMENTNEATTNELGRTARSSAKDGKVGKGRMGKLAGSDVKTSVIFACGTGFDDEDRAWWWKQRSKNRVMLPTGPDGKLEEYWVPKKKIFNKYKFFPIGVKDKPRHPSNLGTRAEWDL